MYQLSKFSPRSTELDIGNIGNIASVLIGLRHTSLSLVNAMLVHIHVYNIQKCESKWTLLLCFFFLTRLSIKWFSAQKKNIFHAWILSSNKSSGCFESCIFGEWPKRIAGALSEGIAHLIKTPQKKNGRSGRLKHLFLRFTIKRHRFMIMSLTWFGFMFMFVFTVRLLHIIHIFLSLLN